MPYRWINRILASAGRNLLTIALLSIFAQTSGHAENVEQVMWILKKDCLGCHNEKKKKGGLLLTSRDALLAGGESGTAVVPGSPNESLLLASLSADADPHMPPKKQLSQAQIELVAQWIKEGAPWDAKIMNGGASPPRGVHLAVIPPSYRPVLAIALAPDSKRLAVGYGNEVIVYDVSKETLRLVHRAIVHPDPVQSIAWSPDGRRLATGAFRRVVIWNPDVLTVDREITSELNDRITALRFHPDGKQLLISDGAVAEVGIVRIIDTQTGAVSVSWEAHEDTVFDLAISPDGKLVATAGGDRFVKVWDLESQQEMARLEGHAAQVLSLGFNADAAQLVTAGADQQLKLWDVKTKEQIGTLGRHNNPINATVWVPAIPAVLAITDSGTLLRYTEFKSHSGAQSSESAQERKLASTDATLYCLAATVDGEQIFAGSHDGQVFGWNKDGKLVTKLNISESQNTTSVGK